MPANPYRWQHDQPAHVVARAELVGQLEQNLRRGLAVKLVGGRGMGKSVLLRQVQQRFQSEPETRVLIIPGPPEQATLTACVEDVAARLGVGALPRTNMDAVMDAADAQGIERVILLVDEADQYVLLGPTGELARAWFNRLEALRKDWIDRFALVVAGGLGILHLGHVLGSGLVSRAETCIAERFGPDELRELSAPLASRGRALGEDALATLEVLSGGNPALATYGLERLWDDDRAPIDVLRAAFAELPARHGGFLRAVQDAVSHRGLVAAPGKVLAIVRERAGAVPRRELVEACEADDPAVDVIQAVQLLQAAGLVGVSGSLHADPLLVYPVASIVNLPTSGASHGDPVQRLDADVGIALAWIHRFGRDFQEKNDLLQEQVFSSLLAVALTMRGWSAQREPVQAAGYPDLRIEWSDGHGHALLEAKLWPHSGYKEAQAQLDDYRVSDTMHAIAVTFGRRGVTGWAEDYERECLAGYTFSRLTPPADLIGCWRVATTGPNGEPRTSTHFLVHVPKRG